MSGIGLPVPPGFTISTAVCAHFYDHDKTYPDALDQQVRNSIAKIEAETGTSICRYDQSPSRVGKVRSAGINAWDDGYGAESGVK